MARKVIWESVTDNASSIGRVEGLVNNISNGIDKIENDINRLKIVTLDLDHRVDALEHKAPKGYYLRLKKGRDQVVVKLG